MPLPRKILARRETVRLSKAGQRERVVIFEYMLGDFGPFVFEYPKDTFNYDLLKADMKKEEAGLESVVSE